MNAKNVPSGGRRTMQQILSEARRSMNTVISADLQQKRTKIYKTVILPVVLNDYEIWSLTLREEQCVEDIWT
jgi:hypothetical protein